MIVVSHGPEHIQIELKLSHLRKSINSSDLNQILTSSRSYQHLELLEETAVHCLTIMWTCAVWLLWVTCYYSCSTDEHLAHAGLYSVGHHNRDEKILNYISLSNLICAKNTKNNFHDYIAILQNIKYIVLRLNKYKIFHFAQPWLSPEASLCWQELRSIALMLISMLM